MGGPARRALAADAVERTEVEQHLVDVDAQSAGVAGAVGFAIDADEIVGDRIELVGGRRALALGTVEAGRAVELRRSEEHTSELQSLMRISYAVFCLKKKKIQNSTQNAIHIETHRTQY